jgi:hypothetical protein
MNLLDFYRNEAVIEYNMQLVLKRPFCQFVVE